MLEVAEIELVGKKQDLRVELEPVREEADVQVEVHPVVGVWVVVLLLAAVQQGVAV